MINKSFSKILIIIMIIILSLGFLVWNHWQASLSPPSSMIIEKNMIDLFRDFKFSDLITIAFSLAVFYLMVLLIFKFLNIEKIPKIKILVYVLVFSLFSFFSGYLGSILLYGGVLDIMSLSLIKGILSISLSLLFIRYYFLLSGKNIWKFIFYLIILNIFLNLFMMAASMALISIQFKFF